jgi:hypothetical protein
MQIFEFHFNPKKKDVSLNTFCYEPEKPQDKQGYLYMAGELLNALPGSETFLSNLSKAVKEEYYSEFYPSVDQSIKKGLIRANDFLASQISKNNVRWLGNLNFGIVSLRNKKIIDIARIGNIKILLIKNNELIDVSKKIDGQDEELQRGYYSPKSFSKITSGRLNPGEKLIIITKNLFELFEKSLILEKIASTNFLTQRSIEEVLEKEREKLLKISGAFLVLDTSRESKDSSLGKILKSPVAEEEIEFSLKQIFRPLVKKRFSFFNPRKKKPVKTKKKIKVGETRINLNLSEKTKKPAHLTIALISILLIGMILFQGNKVEKKETLTLEELREEMARAEKLSPDKLFLALTELWDKIPANETDEEILEIKAEIEARLEKKSNLLMISDPELIYEFSARDLVPQRVLVHQNVLYFFTPFSNKIVAFEIESRNSREFFLPTDKDKGANSARIISNKPVFFVKPNNFFVWDSNEIKFLASLKEPEKDYDFTAFSNFWTSVYFWDTKSKEIVRYTSYTASPELWLKPHAKKPTDIQSMSVDGSVWIVDNQNQIYRYSGGVLAEEMSVSIFPRIKKIVHFFASPSLYRIFFLDPGENRLIITDKKGNLINQLRSQEFNNLIHFSVSENGKEIYLINNLKIYRIKL